MRSFVPYLVWRGGVKKHLALLGLQATLASSIFGITTFAVSADYDPPVGDKWWTAGQEATFPAISHYQNAFGTYSVLNAEGPIETKDHSFFAALGTNGRACVTCHQPANGMSLAAASVRDRWQASAGKDPLFAAIDGSNCPSLLQGEKASHSLLLERGLIRVHLPWPPKASDGLDIDPEFKIDVVRDPTGCNLSPIYGINSPSHSVSVYRRPRVVANLRYVDQSFGAWSLKDGVLLPLDPVTGKRLASNIMADNRFASLQAQAADAIMTHLEATVPADQDVLDKIAGFERQLYGAMSNHRIGGSLTDGGATGGPEALRDGKATVVGGFTFDSDFPELEGWRTSRVLQDQPWDRDWPKQTVKPSRVAEDQESPAQHDFRDSVARGYDLFMYRTFLIRDVANGTDFGLGNPVKNACVLCHNMQRTGMDAAPGFMDIGTTSLPDATRTSELPLFRITCRRDAPPQPYRGRVIYTYDPGRALVTGRCRDVGAINMQQFRGLAARAPYFSNGSAKTLGDVIDYYNRRFKIHYSKRDREDLINFLSVL
jgi:hypothetical protein